MVDIGSLFELVDKQKASDLLITAGAPPVLRIDGKLVRTKNKALRGEDSKRLIYGVLTPEQQNRFERRHEELMREFRRSAEP